MTGNPSLVYRADRSGARARLSYGIGDCDPEGLVEFSV
jgi:hypothetical protein